MTRILFLYCCCCKAKLLKLATTALMMMMMNCFCAMVNRRKVFCPVSSWDHCQRSSPLQISDTLRAGFVLLQDLSLGFVEWSCAAVITTTPWGLQVMRKFSYKLVRLQGWLFVAKGISTELCTWIATMESKCWVNMQLSIMFRCDRNTLTSRWKQFEKQCCSKYWLCHWS